MAVDVGAVAIQHLLLRLRPLNRALRRLVERQAQAAAALARPDVTPLCVTDEEVAQLLDGIEAGLSGAAAGAPEVGPPVTEERAAEEALRVASPAPLPLDRLRDALGLSELEEQAILLTAAPELDRRYERIFAYALDDLNRRQPSVELLCVATAPDAAAAAARLPALGRYGRLRRAGLLLALGDAVCERRQELRIAPTLLELLLTGRGDPGAFRDPAEVPLPAAGVSPGADDAAVERLGAALGSGAVEAVGVFGPRAAGTEEVARALAALAGRPLRRLATDSAAALEAGLDLAAALGAIGWVDVDALGEPGLERLRATIAQRLAARAAPIILSGVHPWRPEELLAARAYAELEVELPGWEARLARWRAALPELAADEVEGVAARFRMSPTEVAAVARVARTAARLPSNGHAAPVQACLDAACATVSRKRCQQFARSIVPRRTARDLVLPPELHRQVLEIARFHRVWPRVAEGWRFGRMATGGGGVKVLFTGDSGTGKTLAAEVVAGEVGVPLLRVDLARVVSKWVGETEKNLESVFGEAEESHAILLFDEADALFGRRGEVSHGADRYANLEVSYLLQRLEDHDGLVILATNLKEHVDRAFTRRFQVMIHFPRPAIADRRRLWAVAFPAEAPVAGDVDVDALARLDLTGAGIIGTARTAALLAADAGADAIHMSHLVRAAHRQFHQEARLLNAADLGQYAALLQGAGG